jgi:predicted O-methyltransferase YrrM
MEKLSEQLVEEIDAYIESLFVAHDPVLAESLRTAETAGLPSINISPNEGKLLYLIAKLAHAQRVLEVGALGGYSAIWLARALPPNGTLISLELDAARAQIARDNLARAGLEAISEVRVGSAAALMREIIASAALPFDLIFIDADKPSYLEYLDLALHLSHPGTVILADNVIRHGGAMQNPPLDENAAAVRAFNQALASHPRLESLVVPIIRHRIDGLSISLVKE